ncbi:eukaryotic translation initiation factor 4E type 2 isoform X1 [Equus quagga]|uniref:eukaryotic translation initiation factor 4E type 2 isoform X1 n=1 Tax=Equus quagga TaxID=89248 RepID=UPI001EE1A662|nr:eukaryotic translation initiation factor 4E type 2 isoform X1 [Equus quagga]
MNNKFDALKDDDSGDHDQNEENSTQKDGEKEKAERDKSQGSSKRKAVVPGPAEHPLQYNYTFWYSRRTPGRPTSSQSYEQNIKQIGTFASVEQFWRFYSHMVRPGDLTGHSDFHLFKEGIKPMWEDDANKNGGKWIIRLRKGLASRCWENLILAMLGEQFMVGEEICGAVVSVRFQEDIISIWNKTASDQATTARIRDTLRRVLNLPPNTIMEYKTHTDSINICERVCVRESSPSHSHSICPVSAVPPSATTAPGNTVVGFSCSLPEFLYVCSSISPSPCSHMLCTDYAHCVHSMDTHASAP